MAQRKVTTKIEEVQEAPLTPPQDDDGGGGETVLSQAEMEIAEFFSTIGSSANRIKIHKMVGGEAQYCGSAEPSIVNEDYILAQYGGGKYRLTAVLNGQYVKGGCRTFTIYEPPYNPLKPAPNSEKSADNSAEISLLREQINRQQEMMLQMLSANQGNQKSDLVEMLQVLSSLQPKQPDMSAMILPMMEIFKTSMEMGKELTGGGGSSWTDIAAKAVEKLPALVQGIAAARSNPGGTMPHASPAPPTVSQVPENTAMTDEEKINEAIKETLNSCKPYALKNVDPMLIVDWMIANMDNAQDQTYKNLALVILNKKFEDIILIDPEIGREPMKSWFEKVYKGLTDYVKAENEAGASGGVAES